MFRQSLYLFKLDMSISNSMGVCFILFLLLFVEISVFKANKVV